ncbi:hypothetical protein NL676_027096 [Syzygium grande]|nr:hypothetical protein NL676_027096 [Syzygium grande]
MLSNADDDNDDDDGWTDGLTVRGSGRDRGPIGRGFPDTRECNSAGIGFGQERTEGGGSFGDDDDDAQNEEISRYLMSDDAVPSLLLREIVKGSLWIARNPDIALRVQRIAG